MILESIVELNGKTMIGWEEIGKSKVSERSVFQFWKEDDNLSIHNNQSNNIIISEAEYAYLDMKYNRNSPLGLSWAGYIDVEKAYSWDPDETIAASLTSKIIGVETPLWTETIATEDDLEYMAFPRLPGYAEIAWSSKESRNWSEYKKRVAKQKSYFERKDINYYPSEDIAW